MRTVAGGSGLGADVSDWVGRVGSVLFRVNATGAAKARSLALGLAGSRVFLTEGVFGEESAVDACFPPEALHPGSEEEAPPEGPDGSGAWEVEVWRLGHGHSGSGGEWDSEFRCSAGRLVSQWHWDSEGVSPPDAQEEGVDWPARSRAMELEGRMLLESPAAARPRGFGP